MNKKRLTLLLDDAQIRIIKSRAALAGLTGSQWVIEQLDLEADAEDPEPVTAAHVDVEQAQDPVTAAQAVEPSSAADPDPGIDALVDLVPDYTGRKMSKLDRDNVLLNLDEAMPEKTPEMVQAIVDMLQKNAIPTDTRKSYVVAWTPKKFNDTVGKIKSRAAKNIKKP